MVFHAGFVGMFMVHTPVSWFL